MFTVYMLALSFECEMEINNSSAQLSMLSWSCFDINTNTTNHWPPWKITIISEYTIAALQPALKNILAIGDLYTQERFLWVYEWKYRFSDLYLYYSYWLRLVWDLVLFVGNNNSGLHFIFTYFYPIRVVKWKCRIMNKNADPNTHKICWWSGE